MTKVFDALYPWKRRSICRSPIHGHLAPYGKMKKPKKKKPLLVTEKTLDEVWDKVKDWGKSPFDVLDQDGKKVFIKNITISKHACKRLLKATKLKFPHYCPMRIILNELLWPDRPTVYGKIYGKRTKYKTRRQIKIENRLKWLDDKIASYKEEKKLLRKEYKRTK